jgi:UDP-glucuronate 4-epimerase
VELMSYIRAVETVLGRKAKLNLSPMQAGDVQVLEADTSLLSAAVGFKPRDAGGGGGAAVRGLRTATYKV